MTNLYYILHQFFHDNQKVKNIISSWNFAIDILGVMPEDCKKALDSPVNDYENAVIVQSAIRENIDYIITRNIKDFANSPIKAVLPSEFIDIFMKGALADFEPLT